MHPVLIDLGFFPVPTYGVLLALAVVVALWTTKLRADRSGLDGTRVADFALWSVIWALVGAKTLLVIVEFRRYVANPEELLGLIRAGGVFLGGFLAALAAAAVLLRRYELPWLPTLDVIVPSLALGQALGRVGCLTAGCCWGKACTLPWAITYTDPVARANVGTPLHVQLHPFPAYAAIFDLGLYLALAALHRRRPVAGRVFASYLVLYGVGRFLLEWTRGDASRGFVFNGALSTSQLIALMMVAAGLGLFGWTARRRAQ